MATPRVRVVVVNFNGGDLVMRCLDALEASQWPHDALEVVVVDNASTDGSPEAIADRFPAVRLIRSDRNLGFAGGNNRALEDLVAPGASGDGPATGDGDVDFVALVNPDAFVEPGWLAPLVEAVSSSPDIGAATPKLLLGPHFAPVRLLTREFRPGGPDPRVLGVCIHGVRDAGTPDDADGEAAHDRWDATVFGVGFFDEEQGEAATFRWSGPEAELALPVPLDTDDVHAVELLVSADTEKPLVFTGSRGRTTVDVGPHPEWVRLELTPPFVDLLNEAGSELVDGAYPANRGLGHPDDGRYDTQTELFAWTASVVLLDVAFLRDVGLFDDELFMYYEDFDLSWRGRLRGWRYVYVPEAQARHVRGGVAGHRNPFVDHLLLRNGLTVLLKDAPLGVARREWARALRDLWRLGRVEVVRPLTRRQRPRPVLTRRRAKALVAALVRAPRAVRERRRIGRRALRSRDEVLASSAPPEESPETPVDPDG